MKFIGRLILLFITLVSIDLSGQVSLSMNKYDYGVLEEDTKLWFDLKVSNKNAQPTKLIKLTNPDSEFQYKFSSMDIPGNGSIDIRIQFNPLEKGKRNMKLTLFFEKETKEFKVNAIVKHIKRDYVACPDFDRTSDYKPGFETTFLVLDKTNNEPIEKANIAMRDFKGNKYDLVCNKKGWAKEDIYLSYYRMIATADGYSDESISSYVNAKKNEFTFYLTPDEIPVVIQEEITEEVESKEEDEQLTINDKVEEENQEEEEIIVDIKEETIPKEFPEKEDENSAYSSREYKSNNIVFLMDVSTSMKKEERLIMLKTAMSSLTDMLRKDDVITLITYATTTEVLLEGESVYDKDKIKNIINGINGKGTTSGGKGLKKAYAIAEKYYTPTANNQVFIATDGAFNIEDKKLPKMVSRQAKNDIKLSVLSLRGSDFSTKKMMILADTGKGDFVKIDDMTSAEEALTFIIKKQSKID